MIRKQLLLFVMMLLSMAASSHDIEVQNADGVTIYYKYINDGTELEVTYCGAESNSYSNEYIGNVVIPEEVTYMNRKRKVTSIGDGAFSGCSSLTSITIPNSVTSIGSSAFSRCSSLTSITIPNSVTSIGGSAFYQCIDLTSIEIPNGVKSIGHYTFYECYSLTSVTIPNSVTSIGSHTFYECYGLTSITIPNSVTSIEERTFYECYSLSSVTIPNSVTSIGYEAFYKCHNLTTVTIPNSVTTIDRYAFRSCSSLSSVTIGNSVTIIGGGAFDVSYISTVISLIKNPFAIYGKTLVNRSFTLNTFNNATLYVPKGTIDKYKATEGWKDFMFIEEGTGDGDTPATQKCEKPTISYKNGQLSFASETEGTEFVTDITDSDIKRHYDANVQLTAMYTISVYATKAGYDNSDVATATLSWIDVEPKMEGITNGIAQVPAKAVLIQAAGGTINVQGCDEGEQVSAYSINGNLVGTVVSQNGAAIINTTLQPGSAAIIKVGEKSIKVAIH